MRLASPIIVIFFQTIFNMSHLLSIAFSAKNMCNKEKVLFFFGRGGWGGTHQLELQQRKSETLAISRGQIAVISP